jgi:hypothetical protein
MEKLFQQSESTKIIRKTITYRLCVLIGSGFIWGIIFLLTI